MRLIIAVSPIGGGTLSEKIIVNIDADLEEIIPTFLENRKKDQTTMESALQTGDLAAIESIAHKLAGNAGSYGLDDLGEIGAQLESVCQAGKKEEAENLISQYKNYLANLEIQYED